MAKLPALSARKIAKILEKNGFNLDHSTGSHRVYYNPESKRRAVVPYHKKDLPKGTLLTILKQSGIPKEKWQ